MPVKALNIHPSSQPYHSQTLTFANILIPVKHTAYGFFIFVTVNHFKGEKEKWNLMSL